MFGTFDVNLADGTKLVKMIRKKKKHIMGDAASVKKRILVICST